MKGWQKKTAPDRADLERRAERVGITRDTVADYFKRLETEWENRGEGITYHCADKAQFLRDGANHLAEQIEFTAKLQKIDPRIKQKWLETPCEAGGFYAIAIDD